MEKIQEASKNGLEVAIDGVSYSRFPHQELMVFLEETPYMMMDYEGDDSGRIVAVNFCSVSKD